MPPEPTSQLDKQTATGPHKAVVALMAIMIVSALNFTVFVFVPLMFEERPGYFPNAPPRRGILELSAIRDAYTPATFVSIQFAKFPSVRWTIFAGLTGATILSAASRRWSHLLSAILIGCAWVSFGLLFVQIVDIFHVVPW